MEAHFYGDFEGEQTTVIKYTELTDDVIHSMDTKELRLYEAAIKSAVMVFEAAEHNWLQEQGRRQLAYDRLAAVRNELSRRGKLA